MRKNAHRTLMAWAAAGAHRKCQSVWTDGRVVYSYETPIMWQNDFGRAVINITKYSPTTSCHQNAFRKQFPTAITVEYGQADFVCRGPDGIER